METDEGKNIKRKILGKQIDREKKEDTDVLVIKNLISPCVKKHH